MSTIDSFLTQLRKQDVRLWLEGDRLRFSAPPGVLTPQLHEQMKARKEEITAFLRQAGQAQQGATTLIPLVERQGELPLSSSQQRLWFLEQLQGPSGAYNVPAALRLEGTLEPGALQRSMDELVRRHEVLRTCYGQVKGRPVQRPLREVRLPMPLVDLQHLPAGERLAHARQRAVEEARKPFDLTREIPLRLSLLRLGPQEHVLLLTLHHLACDGWSLGVLVRELAQLYRAHTSGQAASLPELPLQYADYAAWQLQQLESEAMRQHLAYWRERLKGAPALLDLPTDRPRPSVQSFRGTTRYFTVPASLATQLKQRSREMDCTLFMLLLAAWGVVLSRYSRQQDLVIGTPTANRLPQTEPLIGLFVNTLPLRLSLEGSPTFAELLRQVRRHTLEAHAHQALPFEQLVEALQPPRDLSYNPVFQVLFTLQNTPSERLALPGLVLELLEVDSGTSQVDLALSVQETARGLAAELTGNADLFEPGTLERMEGHLLTLLGAVAADPFQPVARLPLLTEAEQALLLREHNATAREVPPPHTLHGLFEEQVARRPEVIAVRFEGRALSYRELEEQANRVAHHLRSLGVRPGQRVGLFLERSPELLVGLLGILKAGAAYVPLDPLYPEERRALILEDSGVEVLLTEPALASQAPAHCRRVLLSEAAGASAEPLHLPLPGNSLAYVLYTSGSTGRPKGVAIAHASVVNFMRSMQREPGLTEQDTLFAVTTVAFDISVLELFLPLSVGGCVLMASRDTVADGRRLLQVLAASRATVMQATPSTWRMLLELGWSGQPGLKVLCGGEALPPDLLAPLRSRSTSLWNMYGPTETTIWSTTTRLEQGERITLGRPIANTQVYVLDEHLQPVPLGVAGTLYLGGQGVAQGYLHRPELTAERFIPDAFSGVPGARLYCTGDLARALPGGTLEFLGRGDGQVKLRGYRIELGEIEARLLQHPSVQEAAVRLWQAGGEAQLVAYVRPAPGASVDSPAVLQHLRLHLPAYMIPSQLVVLEDMPRTANGKLDRKALPAPGAAQRSAAVAFVAPRTPLEQRLAELWQEVLGVPRVGVLDSFFDLGGHSLKAVQLLARVQEAWAVELSLRTLFQHPTLEEMARYLEAQQPGQSPPPLVAQPRQARRLKRPSEG